MQQFGEYIDSILINLNLDNDSKQELADEMMDHLANLKREHMDKGMSEDAATTKAIYEFGSAKVLHTRMQDAVAGYRTKKNVIFGMLYAMLCIVFYVTVIKLVGPVRGVDANDYAYMIRICVFTGLVDSIGMSVVAYFIPIVSTNVTELKQVLKYNYLMMMFCGTAMFWIISCTIGASGGLGYIALLMIGILAFVPLFSGIIGFTVLKHVDKRTKGHRLVSR